MYLAFQLISIGVAADNLLVSNITGKGFSMLSNHKWILILLLLFIIQNQVLIYGDWFALLIQPPGRQWLASGIITAMGIKILQETKMKSDMIKNLSLGSGHLFSYSLTSSIYVFILGCCAHWLQVEQTHVMKGFLPFVPLFMLLGLALGKYHCNKILISMNVVAGLLVLAGGILCIVQVFEKKF